MGVMPHSYCDIFDLLYLCWPTKYESVTITDASAPAMQIWISNGK